MHTELEWIRQVLPTMEPTRARGYRKWAGESALPADYREYMCSIGPGEIGDIFLIPDPLVLDEPAGLGRLERYFWGAILPGLELRGYEAPASRFPQGLYPWGSTSNGDMMAWVCTGEPEQWTSAFLSEDGELEVTEFCFCDFFARLLREELPFAPEPVSLEIVRFW